MNLFQRKVNGLTRIIDELYTVNFIAYCAIGVFLGGVPGKTENEAYYLYNHGAIAEVSYFVYLYSLIHTVTLIAGIGVVVLTGAFYFLTEAFNHKPLSFDLKLDRANMFQFLPFFAANFFALLAYVLFDGWRKPDTDFFVRLNSNDVMKKLADKCNLLDNQFTGYLYENFFSIVSIKDKRRKLVLTGRINQTPHGVYVRIWRRFNASSIMFSSFLATYVTIALLALVLVFLSLPLGIPVFISKIVYLGLLTVFWYLTVKASSIWDLNKFGEMISFVKETLFE